MKVKKLIYIIIVTITILAMIACDKKYNVTKSKNEDLSGKIIVWSNKDNLSYLKLTGESFKKLYPKVEIEYVNVDKDKLLDKMTSGFTASSGLPDLFSIKDDSINMYVNEFPEGFLDVSSTVSPLKSKFLNSKILQCSIEGKFFAIPWDTNPTAVFYRKDIFTKANVFPEDIKTWKDYIEAGKTIVTNTAGVTKMLPLDEKKEDILFREMLNQLNTGYFDEDGKNVLNSENSIKAMEMISKMNEEGLIYKVDGLPAIKAAINNGAVATLPYGSLLARVLTESAAGQAGKWGVMKLPAFEPGGNNVAAVDGTSIMITKTSKNTKVALKFAEFAMTDSASLEEGFNKYGTLPAYTPFYESAILDKGVPFFDNQKIWLLFKGIAKDSSTTNYTENFSETNVKVIKAQADIFNNHVDIQSTMDALQKD
ncbi:MAG: extracellular solute-binding protein [Clostridiaceae bacterium]|nr:extracellular solute-binding protein [Clostridiaceae bacterium]